MYQNKDMKGLLKRYGKELAFLDATYRTTRYTIPLFLLVVKTNVDYQVVSVFVTETETREAIEEALQFIRDWNPEFKPKVFMTDYSEVEIKGLTNVFGTTASSIKSKMLNFSYILNGTFFGISHSHHSSIRYFSFQHTVYWTLKLGILEQI